MSEKMLPGVNQVWRVMRHRAIQIGALRYNLFVFGAVSAGTTTRRWRQEHAYPRIHAGKLPAVKRRTTSIGSNPEVRNERQKVIKNEYTNKKSESTLVANLPM